MWVVNKCVNDGYLICINEARVQVQIVLTTLYLISQCTHGQSLLCLQLRADEAYGSIQNDPLASFVCQNP